MHVEANPGVDSEVPCARNSVLAYPQAQQGGAGLRHSVLYDCSAPHLELSRIDSALAVRLRLISAAHTRTACIIIVTGHFTTARVASGACVAGWLAGPGAEPP